MNQGYLVQYYSHTASIFSSRAKMMQRTLICECMHCTCHSKMSVLLSQQPIYSNKTSIQPICRIKLQHTVKHIYAQKNLHPKYQAATGIQLSIVYLLELCEHS